MKKNYWLVILCAGGEPMAMTAPTAGDIARAYNSPALIASTTHAALLRAGWTEDTICDVSDPDCCITEAA